MLILLFLVFCVMMRKEKRLTMDMLHYIESGQYNSFEQQATIAAMVHRSAW
jgi:hypothetical protein